MSRAALVVWVALLLGCGSPPPATPAPSPVESAPKGSLDGATDAEVAAYAAEILELAAATEPEVTPRLVAIAEEMGGAMYKLEHKLKARASTERKLRAKMADDGVALRDVVIDDALRYTMKVDDVPPGRHVQAIKAVLDALTAMGHVVVRLKNYWPAGDNYSGINAVFRAPNGLLWELQFHTPASIRVQAETRAMYEELRKVDTPPARKRELFDAMTEAWDRVPIPKGILVPGGLHPNAEIIERPRP
ncbi:MAG TPA: hypothetical protein ENK57_11895 [Polyangiaceae bacterium]|nr:hypothetical protein [Polyangiaceae bacterium]